MHGPRMKRILSADIAALASRARQCGRERSLPQGRKVHARISACGQDGNTFLGNALVQMYGGCGSLVDARKVFDTIGKRDTFSWNFMIAAYAQNGHQVEALRLYRHMLMEGVKPNKFTFFPILSASANLRVLAVGQQIHNHIVATGCQSDVAIRNSLLNMYGKCGNLKDAQMIFDEMHERTVVSWNAMIAAYAQNGCGKQALELYRRMGIEGIQPDRITFLNALHACAVLMSLENGKALHEAIVANGLESNIAIRNSLVNMYSKCGALKTARSVFDEMHERSVISWTVMIAAYVENGYGKEAVELFRQMVTGGVEPDRVTFLSTLDACTTLASLHIGKEIHKLIIARGLGQDVAVRTALVNMYGKCGSLKDARKVFEEMYERNTIPWTVMIRAYVQNNHGREALQLFSQMNLEGVKPDKVTFLSALDACASLASLEDGRMIHGQILSNGLESDVSVRTSLVNMYGKCGSLKDAQVVFDGPHERDLILWTAMITAYAKNGCGREALELFRKMGLEGMKPDRITFLSILDACANSAFLENGRMLHDHVVACGFESDVTIRTALVNMYGKCGVLEDAQAVFDEIHERDIISWNAMIVAHAQNGHSKEALELFRQMVLEGIKPENITFLNILTACSHTGLLDVGQQYFISMSRDYDITPLEEHCVCMSDLLGRLGFLDEAEDLINNTYGRPNAAAWTTMLGASRIHGDVKRGTWAAKQFCKLDPDDTSPYVLLSNLHAAAGKLDDVAM